MFLEKDGVKLRPVEKADAEFLRDMIQHPEVRGNLGRVPEPMNLEQEEEYIESVTENDDRIVFVIEKDGEPVGDIALMNINRTYRRCEFGFAIHPERHGEGIGTTALELVLEYAFNELNMHRIMGGYVEGNEASRRVQEKHGFQEEGRHRDYKFVDGEYRDVIRMSLLEDEWRD